MRTRRSPVRIIAVVGWLLMGGCGVSPVPASTGPPPRLIIKGWTDDGPAGGGILTPAAGPAIKARNKAVAVSWSSDSKVRTAAATDNRANVPADFLTKAHEAGAVRIIVQLRVPESASEAAIEVVKQAVRVEISHTPHHVVRELRGLPLLAIEASPETLRVLSASPHVLRVQEDAVEQPQR